MMEDPFKVTMKYQEITSRMPCRRRRSGAYLFLLPLLLHPLVPGSADPTSSSSTKAKTATRVLGFASSKQNTMLLPKRGKDGMHRSKRAKDKSKKKTAKSESETALDPSMLYVQHCASKGELYFQSGGTLVKISPDGHRVWNSAVVDARNNTLDLSPSDWVSLDGLFGLYTIPSGTIWVLITGSECTYEAPPLWNGQNWLSIRRVTDLELVHVPCRLLSVAQLKEEVRQVRLLRKALKQHDFYYIGNYNGNIVPDMTKNLQQSFQALLQRHNATTQIQNESGGLDESDISIRSEGMTDNRIKREGISGDGLGKNNSSVLWWENPEIKKHTASSGRFFWNEMAVEPLLGRYQQEKESNNLSSRSINLLLQHIWPLTSAFVGVRRQVPVEENPPTGYPALVYDQLLISRRSRYRAGTRFTKRGADATGAVANYAETEQVCFVLSNHERKKQQSLHQVSSHVQTRGSIPLRWSSPTDIKTYRPRVRIGMDPMAQTRAFLAHVMEQLSLYTLPDSGEYHSNHTCPKLVFVNLIDKKSDQGRLGRAFDAVLKAVMEVYAPQNTSNVLLKNATTSLTNGDGTKTSLSQQKEGLEQVITLQPNSVQHIWYDFHAEVKNGRWDRLGKLLKQVKPTLLEHGFFLAQAPTKSDPQWHILHRQKAVVRTNCMDCLDRTNVVQSLFGRFMLFNQLLHHAPPIVVAGNASKSISVLTSNQTQKAQQALPLDYAIAYKKNMLTLPWKKGELAHRLLWADNADAISRLYAGTPALKGDFTRTGKRTKRGALDDGMNSLQRYYLNNFLDADRQEGTDLMVGYAPFSNIDDVTGGDTGSSVSNSSDVVSSMTLQEAARQMLLGNNVFQSRDDDEKHFARIKQYENFPYLRQPLDGVVGGASSQNGGHRPRYRDLRRPPLDLRWLPGDLQDNVRSRALASASHPNAKLRPEFCSAAALAAIDRRAASDEPWWLVHDTSDDENALIDHETAKSELRASINHFGYVLSSFLIGNKAPVTTAALVVGFLGTVYMPTERETCGTEENNLK